MKLNPLSLVLVGALALHARAQVEISAEIIQVFPKRKGMLIEWGGRLVHVHPAPEGCFDGQRFNSLVFRDGEYDYKTVTGAGKIVPSYRMLSDDEMKRRKESADTDAAIRKAAAEAEAERAKLAREKRDKEAKEAAEKFWKEIREKEALEKGIKPGGTNRASSSSPSSKE